ncbi:hypothetical protein [Auritidibacter ignavus]|uniref:hypothetical protein n=1 Tax=Auritidibacter ignavus TaxID=678932 RepID=UPI002FE6832D
MKIDWQGLSEGALEFDGDRFFGEKSDREFLVFSKDVVEELISVEQLRERDFCVGVVFQNECEPVVPPISFLRGSDVRPLDGSGDLLDFFQVLPRKFFGSLGLAFGFSRFCRGPKGPKSKKKSEKTDRCIGPGLENRHGFSIGERSAGNARDPGRGGVGSVLWCGAGLLGRWC